MNPDVLKLLLSIASIVIGTILGVYKDDIKNFFISSRKYRYLKGKWACKWTETSSTQNPSGQTFFDVLEITSINGKKIKGKGDSKNALEWSFNGTISALTITLLYEVKSADDRSGVIILQRDQRNPRKMEGAWCQRKIVEIEHDGRAYQRAEIISGTTVWQRGDT